MPNKAKIQQMIRDYERAAAKTQADLDKYRGERAKTAGGRVLNAQAQRDVQEYQGMAQLLREDPSNYPWER